MKYLTVKELSEKWKMSERRIRALIKEKRIEGVKYENKYLIPENAKKPLDRRIKGQRALEDTSLNRQDFDFKNYRKHYPTSDGYFGRFGGSFLPKHLQKAIDEVYDGYLTIAKSAKFIAELREIRKNYQGRPTPVYHCLNLSNHLGKVQIYLKREDLNHGGSHKLNNAMGQALLAKYLGKKKLIAETGAGSHGAAVAMAAAYFDLECDIYMGAVDTQKQRPNVDRIKVLGANVIAVKEGTQTLKEAVDAAFNAYAKEYKNAFYVLGSAVGPHPYPLMVRDFQEIIGREAKEQFVAMTGELPDVVAACVGGGSNAIGMFQAFLEEKVNIVGVEALGQGPTIGQNSAAVSLGKEMILHGFNSLVLQNEDGSVGDAYTIASGLDYPGVGPEHAFLHEIGRVKYEAITDEEAAEAFFLLSRLEGIIPAIESSHAVAYAIKYARSVSAGSILVCLSGRGDKDMEFMTRKYPNMYK
ncbi:MAG: tryptophan synthase subunit beta [Bacilli bacterium]|jgi:tryptophan synthase beta subunit|nr:tryptophan synthase subunit beta [Bacillota bacterium]OQC49873.1 MAG: Tryptophan synthase beta chain [Tenericutes bacterium ADurb.Bin024]HQB96672.1 tryptophan synthase subunit beta [Bacilli bacterium]